MRVVKHWTRLPREVGDAPSLETFPARLEGALSDLIEWKTSLLVAGAWAGWPSKVPSDPNHPVMLWTDGRMDGWTASGGAWL